MSYLLRMPLLKGSCVYKGVRGVLCWNVPMTLSPSTAHTHTHTHTHSAHTHTHSHLHTHTHTYIHTHTLAHTHTHIHTHTHTHTHIKSNAGTEVSSSYHSNFTVITLSAGVLKEEALRIVIGTKVSS